MSQIIEAENLSKVYHRGLADEKIAVDHVSFSVEEKQVIVFKGASGSGKSSLLSLIGCMSRPTSGLVKVKGRDVSRLPEKSLTAVRRKIFGFIFQQFNLVRGVTLLENVMLPLFPEAIGFRKMTEKAEAVLEKLDLLSKRGRPVQELSGGEQQRAAIARALINDPRIVIADEPTAHLDSRLTAELLAVFAALQEEGRTLIIATHDPEVFESPLVSRVLTMHDGGLRKEESR